MRWWLAVAFLGAVLLVALDPAPGAAQRFDGNELLESCGAVLHFEDQGATDQMTTHRSLWCYGYLGGFEDRGQHLAQCAPGRRITVTQVARVLVHWLRAHPTLLDLPRGVLTEFALAEAFPCTAAPAAAAPAAPPVLPPSPITARKEKRY